MSVQVKRRRESAAFLATFVGAQGELLVDTTNNRVQVHDGATPGGWPAAKLTDIPSSASFATAGTNTNITSLGSLKSVNGGPLAGFHNRLVNGNFSVNQRNYGNGSSLAAGVYGLDRWKAGAGGATVRFSAALPDTPITITSGSLVQIIEAANVEGGQFTLSWVGTASARVFQGSASSSFVASPLAIPGLSAGVATAIELSAGTVGDVQFEPGPVGTAFERRPIGVELALCQRYYQLNRYLYGFACGSTIAAFLWLPKVAMRAAPTMALMTSTPYVESPPYSAAFNGTSSTFALAHNYIAGDEGFDFQIGGFSGLPIAGIAALIPNQVSFSAEL